MKNDVSIYEDDYKTDLTWFNLNPKPNGRVFGNTFKWFNAFRRVSTDGHYWGFGLLQIGRRHLFYIGYSGISILYIGTH